MRVDPRALGVKRIIWFSKEGGEHVLAVRRH